MEDRWDWGGAVCMFAGFFVGGYNFLQRISTFPVLTFFKLKKNFSKNTPYLLPFLLFS